MRKRFVIGFFCAIALATTAMYYGDIVTRNITASGVVATGDGTTSAVAHSFIADANTGINRPGADTVGVVAGGTVTTKFGTDSASFSTNVGIGTTPAVPFEIKTSASNYDGLRLSSSNGSGYIPSIEWYSEYGTDEVKCQIAGAAGGTRGGDILISTRNTAGTLAERIRIDSEGRMGINTLPSYQLDVAGTTRAQLTSTDVNLYIDKDVASVNPANIYFRKARGSGAGVAVNDFLSTVFSQGMSSGSYLNAAAIYTKVEAVTSSHVSAGFYFYTDNGSDFNPRMTLSKDGVLTVPNIYSNTISTRAVYVDSSGNLGTTSSSRRTKYEIKNLTDTSANLLDCQPVSFRYKKTGDVDVGLIAEDVDAAGCKGLVGYDETGKPDYLKYEKIGVYLIPIIKAQQVKIIELEARLQALEDKLKQESVNEICE